MTFSAVDRKLLARLQRLGVVDESHFDTLAERVRETGRPLHRAVVELGLTDEKVATKQFARVHGVDFLDLDSFEPNILVVEYLTSEQAWRYRALPVGLIDETLVIAVADLENVLVQDEIRSLIDRSVRFVLAPRGAIRRALRLYYEGEEDTSADFLPRNSSTANRKPSLTESQTANAQLSERDLRASSGEVRRPNFLGDEDLRSQPTRIVSLSDVETVLEKDGTESTAAVMRAAEYARRTGTPPEVLASASGIDSRNETWSEEHELPRDRETGDPAIEEILREMLDTALVNRAEEIEFPAPSDRQMRTRLRKDGTWHDAIPYPAKYHAALIARLRELAGIEDKGGQPVEAHFQLLGRQGKIPSIACFTPTVRGVRCVVRFPENLPLLQNPLKTLGLEDDIERELEKRLAGEGGGLLLLTANFSRLASQLYASILLDYAGRGHSVRSIEWTMDRRLPDVAQVEAHDVTSILAALAQSENEGPDLLGVSAIPTGEVLARLIAQASRGRAMLGCMTAANAQLGMAAIRAAQSDAMALTLGILAHVHVQRLPRLCPNCRTRLPQSRLPRRLPAWAEGLAREHFMEGEGCSVCGGTGRKGVNWVCEVRRPEPDGSASFVPVRTAEERLATLVAGGELAIHDAI